MDLARLLHRTGVILLFLALVMLILAVVSYASGESLGLGAKGYLLLSGAGLALGATVYAIGTAVEVGRDGKQAAGLK